MSNGLRPLPCTETQSAFQTTQIKDSNTRGSPMTFQSIVIRITPTPILRIVAVLAVGASLTACGGTPKVEPVETTAPAPFELTSSARGPVLTIQDVLFDFEKATLNQQAFGTLRKAADYLESNPQRIAVVEGHTDHTGDQVYNQSLSEARSQSVKEKLMSYGISEDRIKTKGFGETQPVASNKTPDGRQANRRVEVIFEMPNGV